MNYRTIIHTQKTHSSLIFWHGASKLAPFQVWNSYLHAAVSCYLLYFLLQWELQVFQAQEFQLPELAYLL